MTTKVRRHQDAGFVLRLFVAGDAPNSVLARKNLGLALADVSVDQARVEVVDVLTDPERALRDRVLVTPMLVRIAPAPERRIVGCLRDVAGLRIALGFGGPTS